MIENHSLPQPLDFTWVFFFFFFIRDQNIKTTNAIELGAVRGYLFATNYSGHIKIYSWECSLYKCFAYPVCQNDALNQYAAVKMETLGYFFYQRALILKVKDGIESHAIEGFNARPYEASNWTISFLVQEKTNLWSHILYHLIGEFFLFIGNVFQVITTCYRRDLKGSRGIIMQVKKYSHFDLSNNQ